MTTSFHEDRFPVRSYEIDAYQHVNNAAYLNWLENGREGFLKAEGRDYAFYPRNHAAYIVVVRIEIDYRMAAKAGADIRLTTRLARCGRSSVVFRQIIGDALDPSRIFARARVVMCFGDGETASVPIPEDFRAHYSVSSQGDSWTDSEGGER